MAELGNFDRRWRDYRVGIDHAATPLCEFLQRIDVLCVMQTCEPIAIGRLPRGPTATVGQTARVQFRHNVSQPLGALRMVARVVVQKSRVVVE